MFLFTVLDVIILTYDFKVDEHLEKGWHGIIRADVHILSNTKIYIFSKNWRICKTTIYGFTIAEFILEDISSEKRELFFSMMSARININSLESLINKTTNYSHQIIWKFHKHNIYTFYRFNILNQSHKHLFPM